MVNFSQLYQLYSIFTSACFLNSWSVRLSRPTWLKKKGIDDALIQPYSGHETRQSLEIYSRLSLAKAQDTYDDNIKDFPI